MRGDFVNFCFFLSFTVSRARSEIIFRLIKGVKSVCGWNFGHFFIFQRDWMEPFKKEKMTKMTCRSSCCIIFEWIFFIFCTDRLVSPGACPDWLIPDHPIQARDRNQWLVTHNAKTNLTGVGGRRPIEILIITDDVIIQQKFSMAS